MTAQVPPPIGTGSALTFNAPVSTTALQALLTQVVTARTRRIVDHGCGWGEALLLALALAPAATGIGTEVHRPDLDRAAVAAAARGLADRTSFVLGSASDHREPADLAISMGAFTALGDIPGALRALRDDVPTGGRALFGVECWRSTPTRDELAHMWPDAAIDDCSELATLVERVLAAGWRILDMHDSTQAELDEYEVGHMREREAWLAERPGHAVQAEMDRAWIDWLQGHRRPLGFVTFALA